MASKNFGAEMASERWSLESTVINTAILQENAEPSKKGLPTSSAHRQAILQRALRSFFVILQYIPLISEPIQW
jgi:hypothetical protein